MGAESALTMTDATEIVIIGGGIIGAACAAELSSHGHQVVILDAGVPRFGTSTANAGHIVVSHSIPFAAPGMVRTGLNSWIRRTGAFAINPRAGLSLMPWLASFMRHCTQANIEQFHDGLHSLLHTTAERIQDLPLDRTPRGLLQIFTGNGADKKMRDEVRHLEHLGVDVVARNIGEVRSAEPILTDAVQAALELPHDFGLDPQLLWSLLKAHALAHGAVWQAPASAEHITSQGKHFSIQTAAGPITAERVIIAAGVWTSDFTRELGTRLPLLAAKGYSVTLPNCEVMPNRPMLLAHQYTAVDPLAVGLRMSARFELTTPHDRSVPQHRISHLIERARTTLHLPHTVQHTSPWSGLRPASADGAPYIGHLPNHPKIVVATGHGMLGTSLSLGTADLIRRIVEDRPISAAESRFTPARVH